MIKLTGILGLSFLLLASYSGWRISTLHEKVGAAELSCTNRIQTLELEKHREVARIRIEAAEEEMQLREEHREALQALRQELETERERRVAEQEEFEARLDDIATVEVQEWYDVVLPESVLRLR